MPAAKVKLLLVFTKSELTKLLHINPDVPANVVTVPLSVNVPLSVSNDDSV